VPAFARLATNRAAIAWGAGRLRDTVSESPRLDADLLLRYLFGWDRARLLMEIDAPLEEERAADYQRLVERRAAGEPIAYIVGEREFLGLSLRVGPGVLVPRPETEELVEWLAARAAEEPRWRDGPTIVDVGTGTGAIALGLASLLPVARVVGVELSSRALRYARENRARLGLAGRVALVRGDLLAPIGGADLIAANLPYLRTDQAHAGIAQEPSEALYAGQDGLDLYRRLFPQAASILRSPGILAVEIDPEQAEAMCDLARAAFPQAAIAVHRDLAGRDRFVSIRQG
jgi:release factor glutamine methyltransferase